MAVFFKLTLLLGLNLSPQTFDSRTDDTRQNRREAFGEAIPPPPKGKCSKSVYNNQTNCEANKPRPPGREAALDHVGKVASLQYSAQIYSDKSGSDYVCAV